MRETEVLVPKRNRNVPRAWWVRRGGRAAPSGGGGASVTVSRPILRRTALSILGGLAAAAGFEGVAAYIRGRIFRPEHARLRSGPIDGVAFAVLEIRRPDGSCLHGLAATAPRAEALVLYLHGNGGNAAVGAARAAELVRAGYDLVVADYRGYGGNAGVPSEAGLIEDASAFLARARELAGARPVLLVGHSLGGAVAILVAGEGRDRIDGLLTLCAVARVSDLVPAIGRPFLRDGFDALAAASRIRVPWIVAHGEADAVVPAADAVRLAGAAPTATRALRILPGQGHDLAPATLRALVDELAAWVRTG